MKICPACGTKYPDDANFCPMDASKLEARAEREPTGSARPGAGRAAAGAATVAGRFAPSTAPAAIPTGSQCVANDLQAGGPVLLQLVDARTLPTPAMADRALRELKQLAKVKSERILRVVDQGKTEDGRV